MRHVAQEAVLLLLEVVQAGSQPLQPLAQIAQVGRPGDLDRVREIRGSHLADRLVQLPDGPRDQHREDDGQRDRDAGGGEHQVQPLLPPFARGLLQALDRPLGQLVGGAQHRLRTVGEPRVAVGETQAGVGTARLRAQQVVQPRFAATEALQRRQLRSRQRQLRQLPQRRLEFLAHARIVVEQRGVFEDEMLPHHPLQRSALLQQLPARATGLGRLLHRLLPLRLQAIERQDQLGQRVDQRQAHEQKRKQDEFEERAGVIHGRRPL